MWARRDSRAAAELLTAGQLAQALGGPHARELITAAAARAPHDPAILAAAYFHAVHAGWDDDPLVGSWLKLAADLSDDTGPLQTVSMKQLFERKPEWDKRETSVWQELARGAIPVFAAGELLNRPLIEHFILQPMANVSALDPRRRSIAYAYSGVHPARPGFSFSKIVLDPTSILTLANLDLLDTVINTYDGIVISHSTLGWLLNELQRVTFHQPRRIKDAHELKALVSSGALRVLSKFHFTDDRLVQEVGTELAELLDRASNLTDATSKVQRLVVRSAPVHRVGSLMDEQADLSAHAHVICSCQSLVEKLRTSGAITISEHQYALSHLKLYEHRWPKEPEIANGAELYLDSLSVTYLKSAAVLHEIKAAGLTAFITEATEMEAIRLIALESLTTQTVDVIRHIRQALAAGIASGRIRARPSDEFDAEAPFNQHPSMKLLALGEEADAFIFDDRFLNKHLTLTHGDQTRQ